MKTAIWYYFSQKINQNLSFNIAETCHLIKKFNLLSKNLPYQAKQIKLGDCCFYIFIAEKIILEMPYYTQPKKIPKKLREKQ